MKPHRIYVQSTLLLCGSYRVQTRQQIDQCITLNINNSTNALDMKKVVLGGSKKTNFGVLLT